jgi:hypothetical protein
MANCLCFCLLAGCLTWPYNYWAPHGQRHVWEGCLRGIWPNGSQAAFRPFRRSIVLLLLLAAAPI